MPRKAGTAPVAARKLPWKNTNELLADIHAVHKDLQDGKITSGDAHAHARLLRTATEVIGVRLEHAKLTDRLKDGSSALPEMKFE